MEKLIKLIESVTEWVGKVFSFSVYLLLIVVVYEVISRKVFGKPTVWAFDLSNMLYGVMFLMGFGYTLKHKMHVGIDIITAKLNPKVQGWIAAVSYLVLFFPFMIIAIKASYVFALQSWQGLERVQSPWGAPVYHFKTFLAVGFVFLLIQGIAEFLKAVQQIRGVRA
ncbi:MAG: TRAP transporter small permease subunit [Deferribacterales bacterium]